MKKNVYNVTVRAIVEQSYEVEARNKEMAIKQAEKSARNEIEYFEEIEETFCELIKESQKFEKAKTEIEWLCNFIDSNEPRENLRYLYSDGECLVSTNGHILGYAKTDLKEGFYNGKYESIKVPSYQKFPNWKRVLPNTGKNEFVNANLDELERTESTKGTLCVKLNDVYVDLDLLEIAINGEKEFSFILSEDNPKESPIGLKSKAGNAVIMPIRI